MCITSNRKCIFSPKPFVVDVHAVFVRTRDKRDQQQMYQSSLYWTYIVIFKSCDAWKWAKDTVYNIPVAWFGSDRGAFTGHTLEHVTRSIHVGADDSTVIVPNWKTSSEAVWIPLHFCPFTHICPIDFDQRTKGNKNQSQCRLKENLLGARLLLVFFGLCV